GHLPQRAGAVTVMRPGSIAASAALLMLAGCEAGSLPFLGEEDPSALPDAGASFDDEGQPADASSMIPDARDARFGDPRRPPALRRAHEDRGDPPLPHRRRLQPRCADHGASLLLHRPPQRAGRAVLLQPALPQAGPEHRLPVTAVHSGTRPFSLPLIFDPGGL